MKNRTLAESSELLRIALPLMSKYTIPVTPENYSVWYEYVAGDNHSLKERMDQILKANGSIDEDITLSIHKNYLDGQADIERAEQAQLGLIEIAKGVENTLKSAHGEANNYEESLNDCQEKFKEDLNVEQLKALVDELSDSTSNMNQRNQKLIDDLEETQREAEELRLELQAAKKEAKTDSLTSLANRAAFFDAIQKMQETGDLSESSHCILMADIDKFKDINDTYGHIFGDKVIKAVAKVMNDNTKGKDIAARFGGEEFIVLLPDTDLKGAAIVAESIRKNLDSARIRKSKVDNAPSKVTISIGVAIIDPEQDIESSIAQADEALYIAKNNGRNRVEVFSG